jgi:hypothetical protein
MRGKYGSMYSIIILLGYYGKGKGYLLDIPMHGHGGGKSKASTQSEIATRRIWVSDIALRPLYSRERHSKHCTRGGVGLGDRLDGYGKPRPRKNSISGPSGTQQVSTMA